MKRKEKKHTLCFFFQNELTVRASSVFLSSFSINLLAFYHEYRSLITCTTLLAIYAIELSERPLLCVFEVFVKSIYVKF